MAGESPEGTEFTGPGFEGGAGYSSQDEFLGTLGTFGEPAAAPPPGWRAAPRPKQRSAALEDARTNSLVLNERMGPMANRRRHRAARPDLGRLRQADVLQREILDVLHRRPFAGV